MSMLQHFYVPNETDEMKALVARDWVEVLGKFGRDEIEKACIRYLERNSRRPTPSDIRALITNGSKNEPPREDEEREIRGRRMIYRGNMGGWFPVS